MAIIAVKHFIDKIYSDQEYMSSIERYRNHPYEEKLDLSVSKGRELGYDFTREEFREVDQIKKFWEKMDGDEALRQKVAGAQAASRRRRWRTSSVLQKPRVSCFPRRTSSPFPKSR